MGDFPWATPTRRARSGQSATADFVAAGHSGAVLTARASWEASCEGEGGYHDTRHTGALGVYPPGAPYPLVAADYSARIEALEFTTVAPGGFGDLACILKLPDARLPRPELGLFSRVALRDGLFTCFSGEWSDPDACAR